MGLLARITPGRSQETPARPELDRLDQLVALLLAWIAQLSQGAAPGSAPHSAETPKLLDRIERLEAKLQRERMDQMALASRLLSIEETLAKLMATAPGAQADPHQR
jgi:glucose-6-phosphate-specific signal transduction histidine kinase